VSYDIEPMCVQVLPKMKILQKGRLDMVCPTESPSDGGIAAMVTKPWKQLSI